MSDSVHAHMLLHELNLHCWDLLDDFPSPISGTLKMFAIASHQSSQLDRLLSHSLCLIPRNLLDDFRVFGDWLFLKLLVEGSSADLLGKLHASFRMRGCGTGNHSCLTHPRRSRP